MKMQRNTIAALLASLALFLGFLGVCPTAVAADGTQGSARPKATRAEFDAYQAAAAEKSPQQKVKLLDDFVAKYPASEYLAFVYSDYWQAYAALHQYTKVIEYLDRLLALPEINDGTRLEAQYRRAATFEYAYNAKSPNLAEQATKGRDAALEGLKILNAFQKPAQATDEQWGTAKKVYGTQFYNTAGICSQYLKDYKSAAEHFRASLAVDPNQAGDDYRLGIVDLQLTPPQSVAGFWALARAIDLKMPDGDKVKKFLHDKIYEYQQPGCESLVDTAINELLALAQNSPDLPTGFNIPSAADLGKVREQANIQTVLADLKVGGEKGKTTWLAVCSGEFPEALGKVFELTAANPDSIVIKAAIGTTEEELNTATAPNANLKIAGQPNAARLEKDSVFRFSGKLTGYAPDPFNLTWENVKINPEDIPEEKGKKPAKRPGKAKP